MFMAVFPYSVITLVGVISIPAKPFQLMEQISHTPAKSQLVSLVKSFHGIIHCLCLVRRPYQHRNRDNLIKYP